MRKLNVVVDTLSQKSTRLLASLRISAAQLIEKICNLDLGRHLSAVDNGEPAVQLNLLQRIRELQRQDSRLIDNLNKLDSKPNF